MPAPPKDILNVLVGRANMYVSPVGTAHPADTIPFDEAWTPAAWYHPGYSDSGLDFGIDKKEKRHYVDDISVPTNITVEETMFKVGFVFAEATLKNLSLAAGGGSLVTQNPTSSLIGKRTLTLSEDLEVVQLGFEGKNAEGFYRRVIIPRVVSVAKIKAQLDRAKNKQVYATEFESVCAITDVKIYEKFANPTV